MKEGIWLEPTLACYARKRRTEKHRNVARKLVLEGSWVQKRLFDIGWSDDSECQACHKEQGTEKQRLYHCPGWNEVRRQIPEACRRWIKKREPQKRSGSGKEVLSGILSVKANGTKAISA